MDDVEKVISKISEDSPYKRRPTQKRTWMTVPEMGKTFDIKEELKKLPDQPGVYIMHDKDDVIIYIGKAKSLTKRVHQYFQASHNEGIKKKQME